MLWWTLQKLKSSDPRVRASAARSLGESRERKAVPALIRALEDGIGDERHAIIEALGAIGHPAAITPLISNLKNRAERRRKGGATAGADAAADECRVCAEALAALGGSSLDPLIELLDSDEKDARRWAAHALGLIRDAKALPPLAAKLSDARSEVRQAAARAMGNLGEPSAIRPLMGILSDKDAEARRAAAEALGILGAKEAVDQLGNAARDPNEPMQLAIVEALRRIGGLPAGRKIRTIQENSRKAVRDAASAALNSMSFDAADAAQRAEAAVLRGDFAASLKEGPAAAAALSSALTSRNVEFRLKAVQALGTLGADAAVAPLLNALDDPDRSVQEAAAGALAGIGNPSVEGLAGLVSSEHSSVRRLAAVALGRIGDAAAVEALLDACRPGRDPSGEDSESCAAMEAAVEALALALSASADSIPQTTLERILSAPAPDSPRTDPNPASQNTWASVRDLARKSLQRRSRF